jgi:hypothetical protein
MHALGIEDGMTKKQYPETRVRMDKHGRILILAALRKAIDVEAGDVLCLQLRDGLLQVKTYKQRVAKAQALVGRYISADVPLVEGFIAERRAEGKREAAEARADDKRHYRIFARGAI